MEKMTWEIMMIYPRMRKNCSRGDCKEQSQPLQQLDEVIDEIKRLMIDQQKRSAERS
jgi:hypothetical protein